MRAAFGFALLAVLATWPLVLSPDRLMLDAGSGHDLFIFLWDFWWVKHAVVDLGANPFFCDLIYAPHGSSLVVHANGLAQSLVSLPFQMAEPGLKGIILATNCIIFFSFWMAGLGAYQLARHVSGSRPGAVLAGVSFTLCNYHFANMVRLHAMAIEIFPWALYFLLLFLEDRRSKHVFALALISALIFYACPEYALFLALLFALFVPLLLWVSPRLRRRPDRRCVRAVILSTALLGALLTPCAVALKKNPPPPPTAEDQGLHGYFSMDLLDFALGNPRHPIHGQVFARAQRWLHANEGFGVGMSYVATLLALSAAIGAIARRRRELWPWMFMTAAFALLALGPRLRIATSDLGLPLPESWLSSLPLLGHARMPMRYIALVHLGLGVLAAIALARLRWRPLWSWLAVLLTVYELWSAPLSFQELRIPSLYQVDARIGEAALLDLPPGIDDSILFEPLHQIVHGQKLVQDLPWFIPRADPKVRKTALGRKMRTIEAALLRGGPLDWAQARRWLAALDIRYVVIRRADLAPQAFARAKGRLASWGPSELSETPDGVRATFVSR